MFASSLKFCGICKKNTRESGSRFLGFIPKCNVKQVQLLINNFLGLTAGGRSGKHGAFLDGVEAQK